MTWPGHPWDDAAVVIAASIIPPVPPIPTPTTRTAIKVDSGAPGPADYPQGLVVQHFKPQVFKDMQDIFGIQDQEIINFTEPKKKKIDLSALTALGIL